MQQLLLVRWLAIATGALLAPAQARAQTTELASLSSAGVQGNWSSLECSISSDGRCVAFWSVATNLVPADTNSAGDVFVHDRVTGATEIVSVSTAGAQGNAISDLPSISADGRCVAFHSVATNLVPGDTNGAADVLVRDRQTGTTNLVSLSTAGVQGNANSGQPSISADGRYVAFHGAATNLVSGGIQGGNNVFVRDRLSGTTELVSLSNAGLPGNLESYEPSISADGRFVAFASRATNMLDYLDANAAATDGFLRDRQNGTTVLVSVSSLGDQANAESFAPAISADGFVVAFESVATNLLPFPDANGSLSDVFVRDLRTGKTELASSSSAEVQGNSVSVEVSISADGRFVAFKSFATNLVAPDATTGCDVFVRDRLSGTTERVNVNDAGIQGSSDATYASISADGRSVAFSSNAQNLLESPDTNGLAADVFVRDRGEPPILVSCSGDAAAAVCPCANPGIAGHGCENSAGTGGAVLSAAGTPSLSADMLTLTASGEPPSALSIFMQGSALVLPAFSGDGLRCAGGSLKRLYVKGASGGVTSAPEASDPSISTQSASMGDAISMGATLHYQTYYRDPDPTFCPDPPGSTWNLTQALSLVWSP